MYRWGRHVYTSHNEAGEVRPTRNRLQDRARDDDTNALIRVKDRLGCGNVTFHKHREPNANPVATFKVCKIADLVEIIVPLFEAYPLHTKKARQFDIWKSIVQLRIGYPVKRAYPEAYCLAF